MISAISWVPKGASRSVPVTADPPSKEEIEEILKAGVLETQEGNENEDGNEDMDATTSEPDHEIAHALAAADALGKGIELFGAGGLHNLYYPSNEMDPYLKDKDDDDSEELDDMTIKPDDAVIVCAQNKDDVSHLQVYVLEDSEGDFNLYPHHEI